MSFKILITNILLLFSVHSFAQDISKIVLPSGTAWNQLKEGEQVDFDLNVEGKNCNKFRFSIQQGKLDGMNFDSSAKATSLGSLTSSSARTTIRIGEVSFWNSLVAMGLSTSLMLISTIVRAEFLRTCRLDLNSKKSPAVQLKIRSTCCATVSFTRPS